MSRPLNAEGFDLGIGDVDSPLTAALLLADLLRHADGELAAGGQWGRAEAANPRRESATVVSFTAEFTSSRLSRRDGLPLTVGGGVKRTFRITIGEI